MNPRHLNHSPPNPKHSSLSLAMRPSRALGGLTVLVALAIGLLLSSVLSIQAQEGPIDYPENGTDPVARFTATDPEGDEITWTLAGDDAADFDISDDGVLTFDSPPDFEVPVDADTNNTYAVTVTATDDDTPLADTHEVTVSVANVEEAATVGIELSSLQPQVSTAITVTYVDGVGNPLVDAAGAAHTGIMDPDRDKDDATSTAIPAEDVTWQWSKSSSKSGSYTDIAGDAAKAVSYTPGSGDSGMYLRVTGTYEDGQGKGKIVQATSAYPVREFSRSSAPAFPEDFDAQMDGDNPPSAEIGDGATAGAAAGDPIVANDAESDRLTYSLTADTGGTATHADVFQIDRATGQVSVGLGKTVHPTSDTGETASATVVVGDTFTFTITASDPEGLSDTVTMTVTVGAEDEAPVFTEEGGQAAHTFEEIPVGTTSPDLAVHTFAATDVEGDTVTLSMSGADSSKFTFTPADGSLSFAAAPDFEAPGSADGDNVYQITITAASTGSGEGATEKRTELAVTVTVTNENDPGTISLSAQLPRRGFALTATAPSDSDGRVSGVTWKWERDETGTATSPSSDCAAIADDGWEDAKGAGATSASYTPVAGDVGKCLRATASYADAHGPDKSASVVSARTVAAARNLAPVFTDEDGDDTNGVQLNQREVAENAAADATVGDPIPATDTEDAETADNAALTFALSGADAGPFAIASPGGQITVRAANTLNHETKDTYTVTVTVRDLQGLNSSIDLTIKVTDVNEAPEVSGPSSETYAENGTGAVARFTATDPEDDAITWSKSGDDEALFAISEDGVLTFVSPPNFEAPGDTGTNNIYAVTVTATDDDDAPLAGTHAVMVEVTNVEEAATVGIELSSLQPQVSTAITVAYVDGVGNPLVDMDGAAHTGIVDDDRDKDDATSMDIPAGDVTWQWSKSSSKSGRFTDIAGDDAQLVSYTPEAADSGMYLRVTGTYEDGHGEGKIVQATSAYPVRAFLSGNSAPAFPDDFDAQMENDQDPSAEIDDGDTAGTAAGDPIVATDPNSQDQNRLTYSLTADTGGTATHADVFQIDRATGQVSVGLGKTVHPTSDTGETASATVALGDSFTFTITATDPSGLTDTVDMTVTVEAEDEAPVFTAGETSHEFAENTDVATAVYTFVATDAEGDTVTLSMSGADMSKFTLTAGALTFQTAPDFEAPGSADGDNVYEITITAASTGSATGATEKRTALAVTVTVTNENDPGTISLSAAQPRVGFALTATAPSDTDGGVRGVTWKWESAAAAADFDDATATITEIKGATSASYTPVEDDAGRFLRATASYTDAHGPDKSASVVSEQAVQAAHNLAPVFTDEDTETTGTQLDPREVAENSDAGTNVGDPIVATDTADAEPGDNDALTFALSGADAGPFAIAATGQITVRAANTLDHETKDTYTVTVTVSDLEGLSSSIDLTIKVTDVNEPPEVMQAGSIIPNRAPTFPSASASRSVPENTAADMNIGAPVEANDPDNDRLTYTLEGTDAASFGINDGTGQLLTKADLDRETKSTYMVVVRAADPDGLSATISVDITVTDVDENQVPEFPFPTVQREVAENTAADQNIGAPVAATDADGDRLTYALSGADMADFAIDRATGQLKTKSALDYEAKRTYTVTVTARDSSGGQATVTVTVTVTNVDEDGAVGLSPAQASVGTAITATLTDPDGSISAAAWQWERAATAGGSYADISGATAASYTPVDADAGMYLRATVSYTDGEGAGKSAMSSAVMVPAVVPTTLLERYDADDSGAIELEEAFQAVDDYFDNLITLEQVFEVIDLYFG
ncbi:MAG: cadherin domain-containing protein [Chloroflexi bacterium]|nr:cadherin domain-containing protein [Chloroflexota bacterium]